MTTRLTDIGWLTDAQRGVLAKHFIKSLESLASFELKDSFADAIAVDGFRALARRARQELGRSDPLAELGQSAGHGGTPVRFAGGKEANG